MHGMDLFGCGAGPLLVRFTQPNPQPFSQNCKQNTCPRKGRASGPQLTDCPSIKHFEKEKSKKSGKEFEDAVVVHVGGVRQPPDPDPARVPQDPQAVHQGRHQGGAPKRQKRVALGPIGMYSVISIINISGSKKYYWAIWL